jgi:transglutaminase-like putative cysteine protease
MSSVTLDIEHTTLYRYKNPVTFGEHRVVFLPNSNHAADVIRYSLETNVSSEVRWIMDALSNNVALVSVKETTDCLSFICRLQLEHFGFKRIETFPLAARAQEVPIQYTPDEWLDLAPFLRPHEEDPDGSLAAWGKQFIAGPQDNTLDVLHRMMEDIGKTFHYQARAAQGTQAPGETLHKKSGTCRDYAWLMIEALRRLGFACRFVSGYLYDATLDGDDVGMTGAGATHAWLQVYLPGAGWQNYDPTNRITAGFDLILVAIARHPTQAIPLSGVWYGEAQDYLGMDIEVQVHKVGGKALSAH